MYGAFLVAQCKESACNMGDLGSIHPWVGKISWRRAWQFTPVFLPGKIPRTEDPGRLQFMVLQKSWTQLSNWSHTHEGRWAENIGGLPPYFYWKLVNPVWTRRCHDGEILGWPKSSLHKRLQKKLEWNFWPTQYLAAASRFNEPLY